MSQRLVFQFHSECCGQADFNILGPTGLACEMGEQNLRGK